MSDSTTETRIESLLSIPSQRWAPAIFGVVPPGSSRRRPGDVLRVVAATVLVALTASASHVLVAREKNFFKLFASLPSWFRSGAVTTYRLTTVAVVVGLLVALIVARRARLVLLLLFASVLGLVTSLLLRYGVDASAPRAAAGMKIDGSVPEYPVILLAVATTAMLVAGPYLVVPARRLLHVDVAVASVACIIGVVGLPLDVVGSIALGWGVAAAFHLVFGTPAATPSMTDVSEALTALGVSVRDLQLAEYQVWGETRFIGNGADGSRIAVDVIGRDAADARLFAKLWRAALYKDSGTSVALTRAQQLEHRAYLLLLAARAGVPVSDVVIAGRGGSREIATLVLREPGGGPLDELSATDLTDAVLDNAWANIGRLSRARIVHGSLRAQNVALRDDGTTALVDFAFGTAPATPEQCRRDAVEFLVTTAALVGPERALAAADRRLGHAELAEVLPMVESAALSSTTRHAVEDPKQLCATLREQGATLTGTELTKPIELHRVSAGDLLIAAGTILGVYLLIGQLTGIDYETVFQNAIWGWVGVAFVLSFVPNFTGAISLMGAVAVRLPFRPVLGEQFANNFTGLVGGTVATTALVIRFFQKQGQTVAVAASSGVLNSLASGAVQLVLVTIGVITTGSSFEVPSDSGLETVVIIGIIGAAIALIVLLVIPRLRKRIRSILEPQWESARENLRGILTTPSKAAMLFGGNVASQIAFALVLDAALHAYGASLPLMQIILINSLASIIGGAAPVPGGLGVVEAGLIGGFTAAGIPQSVAVATTFTARLFTAYLPPIWGWFALRWLRQNEYV
jgi:uncharacterized membrane protein YbhN (UPF0104 family)/tRNA A-37 threonylcarbamoyl transferase component Bud32